MNLPDYIVIGETKCGTTPLYNYLIKHPQILDTFGNGEGYDDTYKTKELRFFDGTSWQPAGGAMSGILDHIHTYDGDIYSVENIQVPNPGFIDGGDA